MYVLEFTAPMFLVVYLRLCTIHVLHSQLKKPSVNYGTGTYAKSSISYQPLTWIWFQKEHFIEMFILLNFVAVILSALGAPSGDQQMRNDVLLDCKSKVAVLTNPYCVDVSALFCF